MPDCAVDDVITGVNHITPAVRDLDRSYRFYVETLGSRPLARWSKGAYLLLGDLWLCLTLHERTRCSPLPEYSTSRSMSQPLGSKTRPQVFEPRGPRFDKITGARVPRSISSTRTPQARDPCRRLADPPRRDEKGSRGRRTSNISISGELVTPAKSGNLGREAHRLSRTPAFRRGDGYDTGITHVGDR